MISLRDFSFSHAEEKVYAATTVRCYLNSLSKYWNFLLIELCPQCDSPAQLDILAVRSGLTSKSVVKMEKLHKVNRFKKVWLCVPKQKKRFRHQLTGKMEKNDKLMYSMVP